MGMGPGSLGDIPRLSQLLREVREPWVSPSSEHGRVRETEPGCPLWPLEAGINQAAGGGWSTLLASKRNSSEKKLTRLKLNSS